MDALGLAGRWRHRRASLSVVTAVLVTTVAGCGSTPGGVGARHTPTTAPSGTSVPRPVPPPERCQAWGCRPRQSVTLAPAWTLRLWLSPDELNYHSRPVVELTRGRAAVQWWISPHGDGWNGSLTCLTGEPEPNCALIDSLGMHADVAETLILRAGRLVHPARAEAITNSVGMRVADLNRDGYLDVIGTSNDYQPNFAQGHDYWQTFRYHDGRLTLTGCARQLKSVPAPTRLLTGTCPSNGTTTASGSHSSP
jgi:hypothetical protein